MAVPRHIVIPIVSYPLRILAVLMTIGSMKLFELPYLMVRGGPGDATKTLGIILYNQGFVNWQYWQRGCDRGDHFPALPRVHGEPIHPAEREETRNERHHP